MTSRPAKSFGRTGLNDTLRFLAGAGLADAGLAGAGRDLAQARQPAAIPLPAGS